MSRFRLSIIALTCTVAFGICDGHGQSRSRRAAIALPGPSAALDCEALARVRQPMYRQGRAMGMPPPPAAPTVAPTAPVSQQLDAITVTGSQIKASTPPPPPTPVAVASPAYSSESRVAATPRPPVNRETYQHVADNPVKRASETPLSTFSIDVDTGSYSNVRRMLNAGSRPPADAVRAEEFINSFRYDHAAPATRQTPFRVTTELANAPWNPQRRLLMIGIRGYDVPATQMPPANLVFLVDTSGSMQDADKLPLVKLALCRMLPQLRAQDRISIVAYAGSAGLVLPPTPGNHSRAIYDALARLEAGGSTNGGQGIQLAYAQARRSFIPNGVNRVLLATDGDFNVGVVSQNALETLVADQRQSGIALSTLGFGTGNYNDTVAERLADLGNGNYSYIDSEREARKVLVRNLQATLLTIAQDVKIQIEFNPAQVAEYRLIGYENRALRDEDFANDRVDAGEIGAGHQVTALYEITLVGSGAGQLPPLRYGAAAAAPTAAPAELGLLKLRYKLPGQSASRLIETPIGLRAGGAGSPSLRFAAAVAAFADALRGGERIGMPLTDIARLAEVGGRDPDGDRAEFRALVKKAEPILQGRSEP